MANAYGNLLEVLPKDLKEEYFEDLVKCDGVRIERIVSKGQVRNHSACLTNHTIRTPAVTLTILGY